MAFYLLNINDPVTALKNSKTNFYQKVLGIFTITYSLVVIVDIVTFMITPESPENKTFSYFLYIVGLLIVILYCILYFKFEKLMRFYPEIRR